MHSYASAMIRRLSRELGVDLGEGYFTRYFGLGGSEITLHVDGVGTKSLLAAQFRRPWVAGWDCVIGNTNDVACDGFKPMALVDYIAISGDDEDIVRGILDGVGDAASRVGAVLLGGETAIMPDLVNGFDVSCTVLGIRLANPRRIEEGDVVVGVESSGLHMNGYTLVRRAVLPHSDPHEVVCGSELIDQLLKPTHDYSSLLLRAYGEGHIKAAINVTGGGFGKAARLVRGDLGLDLDPPDPPCIFDFIMRRGSIPLDEMYRVFNMGVGLLLVTSKDHLRDLEGLVGSLGFRYWVMGRVVRNGGSVRVMTREGTIVL